MKKAIKNRSNWEGKWKEGDTKRLRNCPDAGTLIKRPRTPSKGGKGGTGREVKGGKQKENTNHFKI